MQTECNPGGKREAGGRMTHGGSTRKSLGETRSGHMKVWDLSEKIGGERSCGLSPSCCVIIHFLLPALKLKTGLRFLSTLTESPMTFRISSVDR